MAFIGPRKQGVLGKNRATRIPAHTEPKATKPEAPHERKERELFLLMLRKRTNRIEFHPYESRMVQA